MSSTNSLTVEDLGSAAQRDRRKRILDATIALACRRAAEECDPVTDQRGPADYKRALAGELTRRALRSAIARARGQEG